MSTPLEYDGSKEALAWAPYKELYFDTKSKNPGKGRIDLAKATAKCWKRGKRVADPLGANCVDIDICKVTTGKVIKIMGTEPFVVQPKEVFPCAECVFGPLIFPVPRTTLILTKEYGPRCLHERWVKLLTKGGHIGKWIRFDESVRRWAMPHFPLRDASEMKLS